MNNLTKTDFERHLSANGLDQSFIEDFGLQQMQLIFLEKGCRNVRGRWNSVDNFGNYLRVNYHELFHVLFFKWKEE